jgi:hypothetical protein
VWNGVFGGWEVLFGSVQHLEAAAPEVVAKPPEIPTRSEHSALAAESAEHSQLVPRDKSGV